MKRYNQLSQQPFIPVLLGASIGVYSLARSFHEAYRVASISVSRSITGQVNHSSIIIPIVERDMEDETTLLTCLNQIAHAYPDVPMILLGSDEWHIEMITNIRSKLAGKWIVPYADHALIQRVINKTIFYDLCDELGISYPKYISLDPNVALQTDLPFSFPVVIKPTSRVAYESLQFEGKKKVFTAMDREELEEIVILLRNAGYVDNVIIQEFVPGDDSAMYILTIYIAQDGEMKLASFGQTLLEDHTPGGIGNPLVIRTLRNDELVKQAEKIVKHVHFSGFANFDIKYDQRDGKYKFLELNPRLGRSNYYITTAGINPITYYIKDYVENVAMQYAVAEKEALYSVIPKRLLLKNIKEKLLRDRVKQLYKARLVKNPMFYFSVEKNIKRLFYILASTFNFYRKFKKYPPL